MTHAPVRERGFALVIILSLLVIATIVISAALRRASLQELIVGQQIQGYQRHHELQGVRSIVEIWLARDSSRNFAEQANTGEPVHRLALESGVTYLVYVQDGQGAMLRNLSGIEGEVPRRWIIETLSRMPLDRPDLVRDAGPWRLSLHAAPDEVLEAMAAGDATITRALQRARDERIKDVSAFYSHMERFGVDTLASQALARYIVFTPELWRFDVEAVRTESITRYSVLVELRGNNRRQLAWTEVRDTSQIRGFGPEGGALSNRPVGDRRGFSRIR